MNNEFFDTDYKTSGTIKIADAPIPCMYPEHNPPSHMVYSPGLWQHTCPSCGKTVRFRVPQIIC